MTSHALALPRRSSVFDGVLEHRLLDGLFLLTILTVTFHKLQWSLAGSLTLSDILTSAYLVVFAWDRIGHRDGRFGRTASGCDVDRLPVRRASLIVSVFVGYRRKLTALSLSAV